MLSYPETPNIPLNNTKNTPRTLSLIYMGYWGFRGFSTVSDLFFRNLPKIVELCSQKIENYLAL